MTRRGATALGAAAILGGIGCGAPDADSRAGESRARLDAPPALASLKGVPVPRPEALGQILRDAKAAVVLGKALFWDTRAGSFGQACASCHFHAGADDRAKNALSPGLDNEGGPPVSLAFDPTGSGLPGGPNLTLGPADFPFHRLADPGDRSSAVLFDTDDVASSQGVFHAAFVALTGDGETCAALPDAFHVGASLVRRVEARNTPTVINAVFNHRNFWDGRANEHFNGVSPFGPRDPAAVVYVAGDTAVSAVPLDLPMSSLASQAVGPPTNPFEMSCEGRTFPLVGRKLLGQRPLGGQPVEATDSVLGPLRDPSGRGLATTYADLVRAAFRDVYWRATSPIGGFSQMELNFSLFWGIAIQAYEATLISDDSRLDRYLDGDPGALTGQEKLGLEIFQGKGRCVNCHSGPALTNAATPPLAAAALVERMIMGEGVTAVYDTGFYNTGVRPTVEDRGVGRLDPFGHPLSFTRQEKLRAAGLGAPDAFAVDPGGFEVAPGVPVSANERDAVDGAFKVPGLRNVALTAPYFHNGGTATLAGVVAFYDRGGDRRGGGGSDTSGFGPSGSNLDPDIVPLGLTPDERAALVAFLGALTDDRVRWEKAPFDHPGLLVPNGAVGNATFVINGVAGFAVEAWREIPAVGAGGRSAKGLPPLQ